MTKKSWKVDLNEARAMRKQGAELLHQRVSLLVKVYNDPAFQAHCAETEVNDLDFVDNELADTAATFLTLKAVLDAYPNAEDWSKHNIRDLIATVIESQKKPSGRQTMSWKEKCLAAEKECERLRAENESQRKILEMYAVAGRQ